MAKETFEVVGDFGVLPEIKFNDKTAPESLEVFVLSSENGLNAGEEVKAGQSIDVNYHGVVYGGDVFDSSFARGSSISFPIGVGAVIKGWDEALVGKTTGSRVLISIPPEYGYGARGVPQAGIGGTDTLVFVVDILGTK
ncbi:MAG: FKBP-type peptidyl-prolyl cis-trans isomerase [Candidatus Ancillula sp.]|jgi:peptidylprolyl isomerase|nr:FKBP-type peptidyl-prolyl cis-trans isomerase [Candidatus Ancillula sp.]